jgi:hypothetical protein
MVGWSPTHAKKHGEEVLALLKGYDTKYRECREAEKAEKVAQKKKKTAERQAAKREAAKTERARLQDVRQSQPKKPRPSRSKKPAALGNSPALNLPLPSHPRLPLPTGYENVAPFQLNQAPTAMPSPTPFRPTLWLAGHDQVFANHPTTSQIQSLYHPSIPIVGQSLFYPPSHTPLPPEPFSPQPFPPASSSSHFIHRNHFSP